MNAATGEKGAVLLLGNGLNAIARLDPVSATTHGNQIPTRPAILIGTDRVHGDHDHNDNSDPDCKPD